MTILIVEDNALQVEWMIEILSQKFPAADVLQFNTEHEFRQGFEAVASHPPDLVLMDVMLRWTDPEPDMVLQPDDVAAGGHRRAGLRCQKMLQSDSRTQKIPVILFTALAADSLKPDLKDLPKGVTYLPKDSNPELLVKQVQEAVK